MHPRRPSCENSIVRGSEERLLNVAEASQMLNLKESTLYRWAYERKIPVVKLFGRALRFRLSVIEKLIVDCERPASETIDRSGKQARAK
jgi:excisionase family DNA binding protein